MCDGHGEHDHGEHDTGTTDISPAYYTKSAAWPQIPLWSPTLRVTVRYGHECI